MRRARLSERAGYPVWLKREDLNHTGSHKLNNALGQALLAKRMGKPRIIAETGAGPARRGRRDRCALLGLECVVYMGEEDIRRQQPNVQRMELLGARVAPVAPGAHAEGGDLGRDPRLGRERADTHYIIGSAVGPAPYPALVRELQRDDRRRGARADARAAGRLPDRA
jgi:tryptophan synthase beta chain